jgi:hypothetical protein
MQVPLEQLALTVLQYVWQTPDAHERPAPQSVFREHAVPSVPEPAVTHAAAADSAMSHFSPAGQPHWGSTEQEAPVG